MSGDQTAPMPVLFIGHGSPELARETMALITKTVVRPDEKWGLDHGAWSVIRNIYPLADVPVIEMSIDYNKSPQLFLSWERGQIGSIT